MQGRLRSLLWYVLSGVLGGGEEVGFRGGDRWANDTFVMCVGRCCEGSPRYRCQDCGDGLEGQMDASWL